MAMTPAQLAAQQQTWREELREKAGSDLIYIFSECRVPLEYQYLILVNAGYGSMRLFASMEETRAGVRKVLEDDFNIKAPLADFRIIAASLIAAWEVTREQLTKETQLRAEAKALNLQRPVGTLERQQMRKVVEDVYGRIPASACPSSEYLAIKIEELEQDEPYASPLDEIISMDDAEASVAFAQVTSIKTFHEAHVVKKKQKVQMPSGPEQFRMRMRTEANCFLMLAAKFTNRPWLTNLKREHFETYVDHFLGGKVHQMVVAGADGSMRPLNPAWAIVLSYEFNCRRKVFQWIREESMTLINALAAVVKDSEIKEINFTSPISLGGKRAAEGAAAQADPKKPKGSGKDKGKGQRQRWQAQGQGQSGKGTWRPSAWPSEA